MPDKFVSGLILAAGASTRLGQPKQLLPYKGTILLDWVVQQLESCNGLDEIVVVLGATASELRKKVHFGRSKIVENLSTGQGCSASYRIGIEACDPRVEAMVVLLGDQPEVEPQVVERVVADWQNNRAKITLATYRGRRGHPMIFSKELFDQMITLHGDKAVWKLVDQHPDWVREVPLDRDYPQDINTWEDYEKVIARNSKGV